MKNIYLEILKTGIRGSDMVIATVTECIGSTPQKPGSSALFGKVGLIAGTVGGGVVEGQVQSFALRSTDTKESGYLHFSLSKDISHKEEAICGGKISVLVDANPANHISVFEDIHDSLSRNIPGVLITMVTTVRDTHVLINRYWMTKVIRPQIPLDFIDKIEPEVSDMLSSAGRNIFRKLELSVPGEEPASLFFLELLMPPEHLVIAGAGHIGKAISHLGRMLDFEVTVIDDRIEFANKENLPDADHIIVRDIGEAIQEIDKNRNTYVVIVTRGHADDAKALKSCIGSDSGYIGMIGSRAKTAKMHKEFIQNNWVTEEQWSRIYTPIGLEIGSQTVEEIAISIAAQLIQVRNLINHGVARS